MEGQKHKKKEAALKAKQAAEAALAWTPKKSEVVAEIKTERGTDGAQALSAGKPFQRVDDSYWGEAACKEGALADNSYENTSLETWDSEPSRVRNSCKSSWKAISTARED